MKRISKSNDKFQDLIKDAFKQVAIIETDGNAYIKNEYIEHDAFTDDIHNIKDKLHDYIDPSAAKHTTLEQARGYQNSIDISLAQIDNFLSGDVEFHTHSGRPFMPGGFPAQSYYPAHDKLLQDVIALTELYGAQAHFIDIA